MSNKPVYRTFVSTQPPSAKIAKSMIAVLQHFGWTRVAVIASKHPVYKPIYTEFQVVCSHSLILD